MKIITLVPVKNEGWVLKYSLTNFSLFSDEIIILDDQSTDETLSIVSEFPKVTRYVFDSQGEKNTNMSNRRNTLLAYGRAHGGTHFVFLDADESLTEEFANTLPEQLQTLKPGESLAAPWLNVVAQDNEIVYSSSDTTNYKDFVFCDDGIQMFGTAALSEPRTPTKYSYKVVTYEQARGGILHLQKLAKKHYDLKQAWYRMQEYIEGKRLALRINVTYYFTKNTIIKEPLIARDIFFENNKHFLDFEKSIQEIRDSIHALFKRHTVTYFEPLDIWYIPELHKQFVDISGNSPRAHIPPKWLIVVNNLKNKILH